MFNDLETQSAVLGETDEAVRKEQRIKADRKAANYRSSPLQSFKLSLEGFIKNQISTQKGVSWSKINKTYAHSKLMKPGRTRLTQGKVPLINVYFDQSGSWGPDDIKIGEQAIATLNKYVRQGEIKIDVYYFDTVVSGNRADMVHGGTDLAPVISHINSTKPDNVIIMTDRDGDWTTYPGSATVPGAVWFLWRNAVSEKLKQHLKGKQLTRSFELK
jgi:predicted metal-dependent peptidase